MEKDLEKLVDEYQLKYIESKNGIWTKESIDNEIIEKIRKNKMKIIEIIKNRELEKERKEQAEYDHLKDKLPKIEIEQNEENKEKTQKLLEEAEKLTYFSGEEMGGVNLGISRKKNMLRREAQKYCSHDIETKYNYTYTADARKELIRTIKCKKCDYEKSDKVSDELDAETILGC